MYSSPFLADEIATFRKKRIQGSFQAFATVAVWRNLSAYSRYGHSLWPRSQMRKKSRKG